MPTTKRALVRTLLECGATHAFTLPGLGVTWMLDEFDEVRDRLRLVLGRSEQIASVMAQVYGRLTGKPGIFLAQGPFASTTGGFGILEAHFSGSPMVIVTDTSCYDGFGMYGVYQTMTGDYGAGDVRAVLKTMTKFTAYATEPHEAIYGLQMAYKHASLPRRGPAAVILKTPIIRREMPDQTRIRLYPTEGYLEYTPPRPDPEALRTLAAWLAEAATPVFLVGHGVQNERARALLAAVADRAGIAVVTSYNGKGAVDETRPYAAGMLGTWGARSANRALGAADLVVVLGASLGPDYLRFRDDAMVDPRRQRIVHVDVDPRHAGWVVPVAMSIHGDAADVLAALAAADLGEDKRAGRLAAIVATTERWGFGTLPAAASAPGTMHFADLVRAVDAHLTPRDMLVLDAGSNRIWLTSTLRVRTPGQLVVAGGIGGMGWGPPAAAATKLVHPDRHVTCVVGDGGMAMTMSVLSTCVQEDLPITVVVANNGGLGMVRDNQKTRRAIGVDFAPMDFARIAEGMGCRGVRVADASALRDAMAEARNTGGPTVIDAAIDPAASHVPVSDY